MPVARMPGRRPDPYLEHRAAIEAEFTVPALAGVLATALGSALGFVLDLARGAAAVIRVAAAPVTTCAPIKRELRQLTGECCDGACRLPGQVCPYVDAIFRPDPPQYEATSGVRFWLSALVDSLSQRTSWSETHVDD